MTSWRYHLPVMALGLVALSCSEPRGPLSPPVIVPTPAPPKPAPVAPAVELGVVTQMPISTYFPLQQTGAALTYDVRPGIYYSLGHIPGAVSWPKGGYEAHLTAREAEIRAALAAKRPIVIYCTDLACPDSTAIANQLAARGHSVAILVGGFEEWKTAGMPTE
jgi:rhodanese-related sulfurtransferase